jgi:hypothetical protein
MGRGVGVQLGDCGRVSFGGCDSFTSHFSGICLTLAGYCVYHSGCYYTDNMTYGCGDARRNPAVNLFSRLSPRFRRRFLAFK